MTIWEVSHHFKHTKKGFDEFAVKHEDGATSEVGVNWGMSDIFLRNPAGASPQIYRTKETRCSILKGQTEQRDLQKAVFSGNVSQDG